MCLNVISKPRQRGSLGIPGLSSHKKELKKETAVVVLRSPMVVFLLFVTSSAGSSTVL